MTTFNIKSIFFAMATVLLVSVAATGCSKSGSKPGGVHTVDYGTHAINPQLAGKWMWTERSDSGYYDDNGVYQGSAYEFATKVAVDSKGNGTYFDHIAAGAGGSQFCR